MVDIKEIEDKVSAKLAEITESTKSDIQAIFEGKKEVVKEMDDEEEVCEDCGKEECECEKEEVTEGEDKEEDDDEDDKEEEDEDDKEEDDKE